MRVAFWTYLAVALALVATDAGAQFRPSGRRRPSSVGPARSVPSPGPDRRRTSPPLEAPQSPQPSTSAPLAEAPPNLDLNRPEAEVVRVARRFDEELRAAGKHEAADALLAKVGLAYPNNLEIVELAASRAKAFGQWATSVEWYRRALERVTDTKKRCLLLERLRDGSLDSNDLVEALRYHDRLLEASSHDDTLNIAWAHHLLTHRQLPAARTTIERLGERPNVQAREKAILYRELARAELAMGLTALAQSSLERAQPFVGTDESLRLEFDTLRVEAARMTGTLATVLTSLEARKPKPIPLRRLLVKGYTETGQTERALALLRKTPELQSLRCPILELAGRVDESLECQTEQVRRSPGQVDQAISLADRFLQRREIDRARTVLALAERTLGPSTHALSQVADAWERLGDHPRALKLLERLEPKRTRASALTRPGGPETAPTAPSGFHLIEAAEEEVESGNVEHAVALVEQHLSQSARLPRQWARAAKVLERAVVNGKTRELDWYDKAEALWRKILDTPTATDQERGTAIEHIVRNWTVQGLLEKRTDELAKRYAGTVLSLPHALWLAEAEYRREHLERAFAILMTAASTTTNPWPVLRRLEQLAVGDNNYDLALRFAERRFLAPTATERPSFETAVEYAAKALRPTQALEYAKRWTVAEPNRAAAWVSLAHRERQASQWQASRQSLGHAYELDPSRFDTLLELATWYKEDGDASSSVSLAIKLLSTDADETRLIEAYQLAISLASTKPIRLALEQALRVARGNTPRSSRLRDALLTLYDQRLTNEPELPKGETDAAFVHRASLVLIESLSDPRESTHERALGLLERLKPREAALPLFRFAVEHETSTLGRRAFLVLAALRANEVLPPLIAWFDSSEPHRPSSEVALAAFNCLAQYEAPTATAAIRRRLEDPRQELVALSVLALVQRNAPGLARTFETVLRKSNTVALVRAATALGLHALEPARNLATVLPKPTSRIERLVLTSILAEQPDAPTQGMLADLLCNDAFADQTFADAAVGLASDHRIEFSTAFRTPENTLTPETLIVHLLRKPISDRARHDALKRLLPALMTACRRRIVHDPESARRLGRIFVGDGTTLRFGPLAPNLENLTVAEQTEQKTLLENWFDATSDAFRSYRTHPDPELRELALGLAVLRGNEPVTLTAALVDPHPNVRESAIRWSSRYTETEVLFALSQRVTEDELPRLRALAATRLGERGPRPLPSASVAALVRAARRDPFASVRRAALDALARDNPVAAKPELSYAESSDQEPELRAFARKLLESRP